MITPRDFDRFRELAQQHRLIPVCRTLIADSLTPVSAFRRLDQGGTGCLFESVIGGEKVGRYSFVAFDPYRTITAVRNHVTISDATGDRVFDAQDPLDELRRAIASESMAHPPDMPPFAGGAVGFAGYDVVRYVENLPNAPADDRGLPDLFFGFFDRMLVFDHVSKKLIVVALAKVSEEISPQASFAAVCQRLDETVAQLQQPTDRLDLIDVEVGPSLELPTRSNVTQERFHEIVKGCVDYIRAGDIFQVVVSQRLETKIDCDPFEIYRTLRTVNPSPFMFFLRTPKVTLVGSSPEIMCRVVDGKVTVRPLAGTRRRGQTDEEDQRLEAELLADPKERAEHVMLVDLGRNDVGRVAEFGSVELPDVMVVERYSHVMHISSTVNGKLRPDCDAFDALAASLPAGTVSGAPKVRAMEIIDEFETTRRGPYAGAVGYVDFAGNMDTCIALRTIVVSQGTAYVQAGAGIVADSDPEAEYQETLNKARGMLKAIELAERRHRSRA